MDKNRKTAYLILTEIETKQAYSNLSVNHYIKQEKPETPGFVREVVYGVLRHKIRLDYIIKTLLKNPKARLKRSDKIVLRMGLYQLIYMDSVPQYAAINESVILAKAFCKGRDGFINGMLRGYIKTEGKISFPEPGKDLVQSLSVEYSYAPWIIELWISQFGREKTECILKSGNETPRLCIRTNQLKMKPEKLEEKLSQKGYNVEKIVQIPEGLYIEGKELLLSEEYLDGYFSIQDESSMRAVSCLDPKPGEWIVDVCAAPGGKTLFIAERMKNQGKIFAGDLYESRLELIKKQGTRLGVSCIFTKVWDAQEIQEELVSKADRVLVDVPCSGLGVVRRKPEIKWKEKNEEWEQLPKIQAKILQVAEKYVKIGGTLLYSTCTINRKENEDIVAEFLKKNPEFIKEEEQQLLPGIHGTDGFFFCKMKRKKGC